MNSIFSLCSIRLCFLNTSLVSGFMYNIMNLVVPCGIEGDENYPIIIKQSKL